MAARAVRYVAVRTASVSVDLNDADSSLSDAIGGITDGDDDSIGSTGRGTEEQQQRQGLMEPSDSRGGGYLRWALLAFCWLLSVLLASAVLIALGSWALHTPTSAAHSLFAAITPWLLTSTGSANSAMTAANVTQSDSFNSNSNSNSSSQLDNSTQLAHYAYNDDYLRPDQPCLLHARHPTIPTCTPPPVQPELVEDIHVAFTACGVGIQHVGLTHLKTWVLYTPPSVRLHVYLLTDNVEEARTGFDPVLARWPRRPFNLTYLDLTSLPDDRKKHLDDFRRCSTARVYLPDLLPAEVERIAYTDVDSVVVSDPRWMTAQFELYGEHTLFSFGWETPWWHDDSWYIRHDLHYPWPRPYGINAGVMLMDVGRVRRWQWRNQSYYDNMVQLYNEYGHLFELGDQDWYNCLLAAVKLDQGYDAWVALPFGHNYRSMERDPEPATLNDPRPDKPALVLVHGNNNFFFRGGHPWDEAAFRLYEDWPGWPSAG